MKKARPRIKTNALRAWLEGSGLTSAEFAKRIGCTGPYVSMLVADDPPWPNRQMQIRIAVATNGQVDPNKLAGWS